MLRKSNSPYHHGHFGVTVRARCSVLGADVENAVIQSYPVEIGAAVETSRSVGAVVCFGG